MLLLRCCCLHSISLFLPFNLSLSLILVPLSLLLVRDTSPGITDASYHGLFTIFFSFQRSLSAFFQLLPLSLFLMRAIQSRINVTRAKSVATPAKFTTRFIAESIRAISDGHFYSRLYGSRIELKQTSRERRIASPSRNLILLHSFHPSFSLFLSFFLLSLSLARSLTIPRPTLFSPPFLLSMEN